MCAHPLGEDLQVSHGLTSQALKDYNRYGHYKAVFSLNFVEFDIFRSESEKGSYVNRSPIFLSKSLLILNVKQMSSWMDIFHISWP